ncbi:hypothetical protein DFJ58DRAFT_842252 [Suillus subalutaceus]|uniref:uncharacterized protein n=1 Tax=Suillus subalutaceus TaxID=48586 RepID=UPI001B87AEA0|nr:uncharacterized protein DFJ58DRAFT_842252 [Suillus subalutaceus]KAG1851057.1 hypothetical protein DFJ58DRAFT_842252 [Suillus subalutaceus]
MSSAASFDFIGVRLHAIKSQDGLALFYYALQGWCYDVVAVFSISLFQVDKLVQLIGSPVFTYVDDEVPEDLRLQLLKPEPYPYLFKCLYGLLMLLPQPTAFVSFCNLLNAVYSTGFLHINPKAILDHITIQTRLQRHKMAGSKHALGTDEAHGSDKKFSSFDILVSRVTVLGLYLGDSSNSMPWDKH